MKRVRQLFQKKLTPNEKIVQGSFDTVNKPGFTKEDFLEFFESPDVPIIQEDVPAITAGIFAAILVTGGESFPDISYSAEVEETKPGLVLAENVVIKGTFTGKPFKPFPHLTPIEANGRKIQLDPERMFFTVENGKITKMQVIALGTHTGPMGFYILAGGKV